MERLREIMRKLRAENGCPWDQKQTHKTLRPYLIEEAYEVVEAIDQNDPQLLADELGDLLLQVVFHAQIGEENGDFTMDDVVTAICDKLVRRHPHVFADTQVDSVQDVLVNWEAIKKAEKLNLNRSSLLDGIPKHFPALLRADKVQKKAAKVGFEWDDVSGAITKLEEELNEFNEAVDKSEDELEDELGDVLFCLVNISRYHGLQAEQALNRTTDKFISRFRYIEQQAEKMGKDLSEMTLAQMDELWDEAKLSAQTPTPKDS